MNFFNKIKESISEKVTEIKDDLVEFKKKGDEQFLLRIEAQNRGEIEEIEYIASEPYIEKVEYFEKITHNKKLLKVNADELKKTYESLQEFKKDLLYYLWHDYHLTGVVWQIEIEDYIRYGTKVNKKAYNDTYLSYIDNNITYFWDDSAKLRYIENNDILYKRFDSCIQQIKNILFSNKEKYDYENKQENKEEFTENRNSYYQNNDKEINHYQVLGCTINDDFKVIKIKYRELVKKFHPDIIEGKNLDDEFIKFANERLKEINEAYSMICKDRNAK